MSANAPTLTSFNATPYSYTHVPSLKELLPKTAGIPGIEYIQVCASNAKLAQDSGWGPVHGAKLFTITGPKGHSDMLLACRGVPVKGGSTQEGARKMYLDDDVYRLTGLWRGYLPKNLQEEFDVSELSKTEDVDVDVVAKDVVVTPTKQASTKASIRPSSSSLEAAIARAK